LITLFTSNSKHIWDTISLIRDIPGEIADRLPTKDVRQYETKKVNINGEILNLETDIIPVVEYLNKLELPLPQGEGIPSSQS